MLAVGMGYVGIVINEGRRLMAIALQVLGVLGR
jgi:hypothetical protein